MDGAGGTFFLHGAAGIVHNLRVRAYTLKSPGPVVFNNFFKDSDGLCSFTRRNQGYP
jgi:hypothetical protein